MSRMNEAQDEVSGVKGAVEQAVGHVRDQASHVAGKISDAASQSYEHLRDTASDYYQQGREKAQHWQEAVEDYVTERPIKSLLIAAGIGALLGVLWKKS